MYSTPIHKAPPSARPQSPPPANVDAGALHRPTHGVYQQLLLRTRHAQHLVWSPGCTVCETHTPLKIQSTGARPVTPHLHGAGLTPPTPPRQSNTSHPQPSVRTVANGALLMPRVAAGNSQIHNAPSDLSSNDDERRHHINCCTSLLCARGCDCMWLTKLCFVIRCNWGSAAIEPHTRCILQRAGWYRETNI